LTVTEPTTTASIRVHGDVGPRPGEPLVLSVDGELESGTAAEFSAAIAAAAGGESGPDVLLDLGRLYRLDPAGLGAIAEAAADLARHGRRLVLACVRPRVREFLSVAGAEALVPAFPTLEDAALHM
jgi:anti-anti-sigma factor